MLLNENTHKTVILIFADEAKNDAKRKNLCAATAAFDFLIEKTTQVVQQSALPYILHTRNFQEGKTFGERYKHALQSAFEKGYENVISIGTDTPALTTMHLLQAAQSVLEGQVVLGKSYDGGFYLLGINKHAFAKARQPHTHHTSFEQLPWNSGNVARALVKLLNQEHNNVFYLEKLHDLDSFDDLKRILDSGKLDCIIIIDLFKSLLSNESFPVTGLTLSGTQALLKIHGNKGSPLAA